MSVEMNNLSGELKSRLFLNDLSVVGLVAELGGELKKSGGQIFMRTAGFRGIGA
jgi:hypothetical protein